jgi:hypothetical protein
LVERAGWLMGDDAEAKRLTARVAELSRLLDAAGLPAWRAARPLACACASLSRS